jgi:hypothetical protein
MTMFEAIAIIASAVALLGVAVLWNRSNAHDAQIAHAEAADKSAPTHADLGAVYREINQYAGQLNHLSGTVDQINANVNLLLSKQMSRDRD